MLNTSFYHTLNFISKIDLNVGSQCLLVMEWKVQFFLFHIYMYVYVCVCISLLQAIKEYLKSALEIATALFKSPDPPVSYLGSVWFK
jgi:hypothetical protein